MAEETDRGSSDRQASWVAFKTLRQRPTVVGRTDDGDTVYEVRSVRLVFRPGSSHFNRLVTCARCGRDVPGSPILSVADLDRPAAPVFCDRCARSAGPLYPRIRAEREDPPAPGPPAEAPPAPIEGAAEAGRLAAVEAQLADVLSRMASPVDNAGELSLLAERVAGVLRGQNTELAKLSASVAEVRAEMSELGESNRARDHALSELDQRMVELGGRVATSLPVADPEAVTARDLADLRAGVTDMIDATAQALHVALREALDQLGAEIASLRQRNEGESSAHTHAEIEETLARELVEVGTTLVAALTQGLDQLRSEMGSLQQRVDQSATRSEMEQVTEANRELAQAQRDLDQRVNELAAELAAMPRPDSEAVGGRELRARLVDTIGAEDAELRVDLAEGLSLLRAEIALLEQRNQDELAAVAGQLDALRKELTEALHDIAHETLMAVAEPLRDLTKAREEFERRVEALNASANAAAARLHALEEKAHRSVQKRRPPKALLDSLERQLREAEERLGRL